ncbi:MAG TPA: hypothetical protein VGJ91_02510, partial [Polyangiaceae bacterium]
MTRRPVLFLALLGLGCGKRLEPPGATLEASARSTVTELHADGTVAGLGASAGSSQSSASTPQSGVSTPNRANGPAPGSTDDNLPFTPDGTRIASVAWRTWIYTDVGKQRTRYGYLRVGALVDARGPAIVNDGCEGGWYRVNPRGFVCLGLGASLKLDEPVAVASVNRPIRGHGAPYLYALSNETPPLLYFKLPSKAQMNESEGMDVSQRSANFLERMRAFGKLGKLF